jgi:hypothetical protein
MPNRKGEPPNRSKAVKKRQYASRTPQARSYKKPGRISESGSATYSAVRLGQAALKNLRGGVKTTKGRPAKSKTTTGYYGEEVVRTRAVTRGNAQHARQVNKAVRAAKRNNQSARSTGQTRPPLVRSTKAPTKPSARSISAKYRGRKKK